MSRRKNEFEHRTSIFEGAFRAWSYLGGLDANDVLDKTAHELDPLNHSIQEDKRWLKKGSIHGNGSDIENDTFEDFSLDKSSIREQVSTSSETQKYYYEPLPR